MKESLRVLLALALAVVIGVAIAASGSPALLRAADVLAPIGTLWVNGIRMTVIPLVVSLLITGVASASDVRAVGKLGGRTLLVFLLLLIGLAVLCMPVLPAVFALLPPAATRPPLPAGAAEAAGQLTAAGQGQSAAAWFTSLFPTNPVAAAANGAMLPLIVFTLFFALAVVRLAGPTRETLVSFFAALGSAMLTIVRWVILAAPVGVFALVVPLAAHTGASTAGAMAFYIVVYAAASLAAVLLLYPVVALVAHVPMRRFARAALPMQLIAFSTSSSLASLPAAIEGAERELGLTTRVAGFVLPLAVSMFKLAGPVSWTVGALFVGWFYGVPLHFRELAIVAFAAVFLAAAAPGIPRGAFIMLAPLFQTIGLPVEGIGILIAVDALPDTFATVLNATGNLAAAAIVGNAKGPPSMDGEPLRLEPRA